MGNLFDPKRMAWHFAASTLVTITALAFLVIPMHSASICSPDSIKQASNNAIQVRTQLLAVKVADESAQLGLTVAPETQVLIYQLKNALADLAGKYMNCISTLTLTPSNLEHGLATIVGANKTEITDPTISSFGANLTVSAKFLQSDPLVMRSKSASGFHVVLTPYCSSIRNTKRVGKRFCAGRAVTTKTLGVPSEIFSSMFLFGFPSRGTGCLPWLTGIPRVLHTLVDSTLTLSNQ